MARFKFFLIGTNESPVLEMEAATLRQLNEDLSRNRFIEGQMVEINGHGEDRGVLIPTARIQLVVEAD